ncbi:MAG: SpoVR family protein [Betaproteobacteria bacterium]|jgi:stage V sporulation protein R|nr:SpoVR family protein [Betaproteobacteria bacterium]
MILSQSDMNERLQDYGKRIESLAHSLGLDYYPVDFELVPNNFMNEVAIYGLPIRMPHWSFGVRYIHQLIRQSMGHSRIFEVMFPGNPCHGYLVNSNTLAENTLVTAHVLGHADFAKNNHLFARFAEMSGTNIVEHAAAQAHRIEQAVRDHGQQRVEALLDAALALEPHVDLDQELHRPLYPTHMKPAAPRGDEDSFTGRFRHLPGETEPAAASRERRHAPIPPHPESDLLWFIAQYGPELEDWERDVFLAVRYESFYFYPVFACNIMNEGWATYWHARLLREADFLPSELYLDAVTCHSNVVRPFAGEQQAALAINPYHVGFSMWERIVEQQGMERAREIRRDEDDFGFVRNFLDAELAEKLGLFVYESKSDEGIKVAGRDVNKIREAILAPKFNYGAPHIHVGEMKQDGSLVLVHDHEADGRGLDLERAARVVQYVHRAWRRPVMLQTVDSRGSPHELRSSTA